MRTLTITPRKIALAVAASILLPGVAWASNADGQAAVSGVNAEMREQIKRELMAEMKSQMADEIRRELIADIKNQMTDDIRRQLMTEMKAQMADDIKRQVLADLTGSGAAVAAPAGDAGASDGKAKSRVVRVPYVPESMRREIREQVKQEVLAQAREERWGTPGALPGWLERFNFYGDVRVRADSFSLSRDNPAPTAGNYVTSQTLTRAPEFAGPNGDTLNGLPGSNTQKDFARARLRVRFGGTLKVADTVTAGFQISTGGTSGPTSTNQTMGQGFNKYSLVLDRGYVTYAPSPSLSLTGGRMPNPFFSTDLVWADDLNFEGFAARYSKLLTPKLTGFVAAGWFPLRTDNPLQTSGRDLRGFQTGVNWRLAQTTDLKVGAALYDYHGIEGKQETADRYGLPSASDYGTRYEYPFGMRQKGNTLFAVNAPFSIDTTKPTYWGLASGFRELNLTASLDIARFDPVHIVLTADYVKNLAFDRKKIAERTGSTIVDGKDYGYQAKLMVGHTHMERWGDWNVSLAYRWLGSDAVLDAFTNSDFGMGGTNNKGFILGGSFAVDKNAWISARWMSSQSIESFAPTIEGTTASSAKFKVDLLQVDFNAKF